MPLDFQKSTDQFQLGIWRMNESPEELQHMLTLSPGDLLALNNFKSEYRKQEWFTTRVLLNRLLSPSTVISIVYDAKGKPFLINSAYSISISHTKNFVAVLLAKSDNAGIDLETIQPRIEKIAKRFINEEEQRFIEPGKKINYQHVIWGTKEVLFKMHGKGELNFLEHLHAEKFQLQDKGELTGRIEKNNFRKEYKIFYEQINNLMLVYSIG